MKKNLSNHEENCKKSTQNKNCKNEHTIFALKN